MGEGDNSVGWLQLCVVIKRRIPEQRDGGLWSLSIFRLFQSPSRASPESTGTVNMLVCV